MGFAAATSTFYPTRGFNFEAPQPPPELPKFHLHPSCMRQAIKLTALFGLKAEQYVSPHCTKEIPLSVDLNHLMYGITSIHMLIPTNFES